MSLFRAKKQKYQPFPGFPGIPEILKDKLLGGFKGLHPSVSVRGTFTMIVIEQKVRVNYYPTGEGTGRGDFWKDQKGDHSKTEK